MKKIMLDLDSTLWPLLHGMAEHPGGERVNYTDCESWFGLADLCENGLDGMLALFDLAMTYETMDAVGLFPYAATTARRLHADGVDITVATDRKPIHRDGTRQFLIEQGVPFSALHCDHGIDKIAICQETGIKVVVDDRPDFLKAAVDAGLHTLALRFRYNADMIDELGIAHATNWYDLSPMIDDALDVAYPAVTV